MHYALLLHGPENLGETPSEMTEEMSLRWQAFFEGAAADGVLVSRVPLFSTDHASTIRVRDGERLVTDGPFAETKEQLGGLVVLDLPDLSTAIEYAGRMPCVDAGSVEIRPVLQPPQT